MNFLNYCEEFTLCSFVVCLKLGLINIILTTSYEFYVHNFIQNYILYSTCYSQLNCSDPVFFFFLVSTRHF